MTCSVCIPCLCVLLRLYVFPSAFVPVLSLFIFIAIYIYICIALHWGLSSYVHLPFRLLPQPVRATNQIQYISSSNISRTPLHSFSVGCCFICCQIGYLQIIQIRSPQTSQYSNNVNDLQAHIYFCVIIICAFWGPQLGPKQLSYHLTFHN